MRVRGRILLVAVIFMAATIVNAYQAPATYAAAVLGSRSLTLQANGANGGSAAGLAVNHLFTFTTATTSNIGSIKFQYCTTAADAPLASCITPTGLVTTAATLGTTTGAAGWSLNTTTAGSPYITRAAASIPSGTVVGIQLLNVTNPTANNATFYVRVSTYVSTDTTGVPIDDGTVAASTATPIVLTGIMPESLIFCTGATINSVSNVPDCTTATSGNISFDRLFSPNDTALATSQMAASTNAQYGYVITVNGPTLKSGANTIAAMGTAAVSTKGIAQFGMNLKANTTPAIGAEITQPSDGVNLRGRATTGYNTANTYKFTSGETVADSAQGGAGPTNGQTYTVSYIVNVPGNQLPGTYTTTLTYICTPTF